jgi:hypothetical protein
MRRIITTLALAAAVFAGIVSAPSPAAAAPVPTTRSWLTTIDWSKAGPPPPSKRVIEVVDKISPKSWRVSAAVNWLDKYTASDMRMVARCSGKAYRCITVRTGTNKTSPGWSSGSTITIDLKRTGKLSRYYRYDKYRTWLLAHELGHQFGLGHSKTRGNLMDQYVGRGSLKLTTSQRTHLRKR